MATEKCSKCGYVIATISSDEQFAAERAPCPHCAATDGRAFEVQLAETLTFHERIGTKQRGAAGGKPTRETVAWDDFHRASGEWRALDVVT
jgi:hypothetical protein